MAKDAIEIKASSTGLGATVTGISLSPPVPADLGIALGAALDIHGVLAFPGQHLDDEGLTELAKLWGPLQVHPVAAFLGGTETIGVVFNDAEHPAGDGGDTSFHTDHSFHCEIPNIAALRSVTAPVTGGATTWGDAARALRQLETFDPELVQRCRGLEAVHDPGPRFHHEMEVRMGAELADRVATEFGEGTTHPVISVHPRTGEELLFVNPGFTRRISGLPEEESNQLLALLFRQFQSGGEFAHLWSDGDVVVWDEHRTVHRGPNDFGTQRRELHRCTAGSSAPLPSRSTR